MAKVLLVEDDNNLREIYEARLQAEGYDTATASDGEQALVVAKEAKPDLVISDVMMPKISGFEMLDILRNTDGLKDVKVIMLTALGQAEDKTRADELGADKYLVKSQVTLEDIVKTAHTLLDDAPAPTLPAPAAAEPAATPIESVAAIPTIPDPAPVVPAAEPTAVTADPLTMPPATPSVPAADPVAAANDQVLASALDSLTTPAAERPSDVTAVEVAPPAAAPVIAPAPVVASDTADDDGVGVGHKKIIQPLNEGPNTKPDINQLLAAEEAATAAATAATNPVITPVEPPLAAPTPIVAPAPAATAVPDPALQLSPELQAAIEAADVPSAPAPVPTADPVPVAPVTPVTAAPVTPVAITEPPADPNAPNPNEIAL